MNITNGFRATGIYPVDPNAIPDSAYKPAGALTDYNVDSHMALPVSSSSNAADTTQTVPTDATNVVHGKPSNVTHIDPSNVTQTDLSNVTQTTTTHVTQTVLTDMGTQSDPLMTSVCSYESDVNVSMDNVMSIELSIPLSASESVIDLPISVDPFGNLMSVESSPPQPHCGYVSDIKALEIIESTLTSAQIAKYCAALLSGIELEDKVFQT
ncbi:hypothetical protein DPMN_153162 [Dreissena polymorpha]|uniref:Uncharacterized protein n=1 Tax=Dreissena polymorpha TaxID=45954 RepID=A0A9D4J936_DREPO|nr:hypothetical protein DPMN_153162 [Dreissena polymorpha]